MYTYCVIVPLCIDTLPHTGRSLEICYTVIANFSRSLLTISSFLAESSSTSQFTERYRPFKKSRRSFVNQVSHPWTIHVSISTITRQKITTHATQSNVVRQQRIPRIALLQRVVLSLRRQHRARMYLPTFSQQTQPSHPRSCVPNTTTPHPSHDPPPSAPPNGTRPSY